MLKHFRTLFRKPAPMATGFARPLPAKVSDKRTRLERRTQLVLVINNRRSESRRAIDVALIETLQQETLLKNGTDSSVVVSLSAARRNNGESVVSGGFIPTVAHGCSALATTASAAAPTAVPSSVRSLSGAVSGQGHSEGLALVKQDRPASGTLPLPITFNQAVPGAVRCNINNEPALLAVLGRPWRGLLSGVVSHELASQCVPLDLRCGQVAVLLTESALSQAHWPVVRKRIEAEWSYKITHICIAPSELVALVHTRIVANHQRSPNTPLNHDGSLLRVYDDIVEAAIEGKASDIHFETTDKQGLVRLRVYGELRPWLQLSSALILDCLGAAFGTRIKEQSANGVTFNALNPIAFMTTQKISGSQWDGRVNGRPHATGYKAVMRLLESSTRIAEIPTLKGLGYNASQLRLFEIALARQWGLIIAFGSTGEGKSTTLRSMLVHLPGAANLATYSVESPVEYQMPNVCQFSVPIDVTLTSEEISRKYTATLRDLMRADPDVLMVGEVRDHETAAIAIEFTTTGHRCFTTMHSEGPIDGLARMTGGEMRIPADTLAGGKVINCCLYQKLLPVLCPHCKRPANDLKHGLSLGKRETLRKKYRLDTASMFLANPEGCPQCKPTVVGLAANGTKGVTVAAEIFMPTPDMLPFIADKQWSQVTKMWRGKRTADFSDADMEGKTAFEHGLWQVAQGKVSLVDLEAKFEPIESYAIYEMDGTP